MTAPNEYIKCGLCNTRAKFKNMLLIPHRKDSSLFNPICARCVKNIRKEL
jgi:hypothetical protein